LIGPTFLVGLQYFLAPSILGLASDISFSFSFPVLQLEIPSRRSLPS
jgi:hypothetical protein